MECPGCHYLITPGTSITLQPERAGRSLCPYCLHLLPEVDEVIDPDSTEASGHDHGHDISVERFTLRRRSREQLADRLIKTSHDGRPACPICGHRLNKSDEILLRNTDCFRCHSCGRDLATYAYQKDAYHEQRWLPVIYALADLKDDAKCAGCCYLGAMARSCQEALSWMPGAPSKHSSLVKSILARTEWQVPDGDCLPTCGAIAQYRKLAGEGLILL
jgi:hypothetical protein